MSQTESLTVEILGDSSSLQQELNLVAESLQGLEQQFADVSEATQEFGDSFVGLSAALGPLRALGNELSFVGQQIHALSNQTISLNVQPALDSLSLLMQSAQAAAMQLAEISQASALGAVESTVAGAVFGGNFMGETGTRAFAGGGLVAGPEGIDQVPARLSAGEYVMNREAVTNLGLPFLDQLNRGTNPLESGIEKRPDLAPLTNPEPVSRPKSGLFSDLHGFRQLLATPEPVTQPLPLAERTPQKTSVDQSSSTSTSTSTTTMFAPHIIVQPSPVNLAIPPDLPQRSLSKSEPPPSNRMAPASAVQDHRPQNRVRKETFPSPPSQQTTNQFGGIEIHVSETADVGQLMLDLRRQGIGLRHRRG